MQTETLTEREEVARKNAVALDAILRATGVCIRVPDDWRPTRETSGYIDGWNIPFTCLATNGVLGVFVDEENNAEIRHVDNFKWSVALAITQEDNVGNEITRIERSGAPPTLFSSAKHKVREARPRLTASEKALKLLQDIKIKFTSGS